jgi:hypothetical protein
VDLRTKSDYLPVHIDRLASVMVKHCFLCEGESETFILFTDAQTPTISSLLILLHMSIPHPSQSHSTLYITSLHIFLSLSFLMPALLMLFAAAYVRNIYSFQE